MADLHKLIPDAFTILSESYLHIGRLGVAVVDQEKSPRQAGTIRQLVASVKLYRTIMRHVILNNAGTAIAGIQYIETELLNDLFKFLKKTVAAPPVPVYPTPLTTHTFRFGSTGEGFDLGPGQLGDLITHNSVSWVNLSMGPSGYSLVSTPTGLQWQNLVGNGIPSGGTTGQVLQKASNTSFDAIWASLTPADIGVSASAAELNILDGATIVTNELNQLLGINTGQTIQAQLDGKLSASLPDGQFWVGNGSNIATPRTPTGDVVFNNTGVFAISPEVIVNDDVSAAAGIGRAKLASGSSNRLVINDGSGVMTDAAFITINRALISNASGIPVASDITATELNYLDQATGNIQTQLNQRLVVNLTSPLEGDTLYYNGTQWVNLTRGYTGEVLTSTATSIEWAPATATGLPSGGTTHQYLRKVDGTDFNTEWHTLVMADISDVNTTNTEINLLSGLTTGSTQLNYTSDVIAPIQFQLDQKLPIALANHAIWVGGPGSTAQQVSAGVDNSVLTIISGHPTWQVPPPPGNVSGPVSSTNNALVRWDGASGDAIKNSTIILGDTGDVSGIANTIFVNGSAIRTATSSGNTLLFQAYDVDGTAYTTFATLTAGNTPTFDLNTATTIGTQYIYRVGGTDVSLADGGTGASLSDPGADRIMFWDDSESEVTWLTLGTNLSITGTTINATGGGGSGGHVIEYNGTPLTDRDNLNIYNGLTATDNTPDTDIELGGSLHKNTTITGATGTHSFSFTGLSTFTASNQAGGVVLITGNEARISADGADSIVFASESQVTVRRLTRSVNIDDAGINLTLTSDATGDVFYRNASGYLTRLGIGTSGQVLTVSGGLPVWSAAASGYSDEQAQDAVGNALVNTTTINFTYNDGANQISAIVNDNSISNAKFRQSAALSVVGNATNATANVADITSSASGQILRRTASNTLGWGVDIYSALSYSTDFRSGFTDLSLADVFYVDSILWENVTGSTYTFVEADKTKIKRFTNAGGCTANVPTSLSVGWNSVAYRAVGAGVVTITSSGTLEGFGSTISDETAFTAIYHRGSNIHVLAGGGGSGSGSVTSVGLLNITDFATVTGTNPITSTGSFGYTLNNQNANLFLAGPPSGAAATPVFRAIQLSDIPFLTFEEVSGTTYNFVAADDKKVKVVTNASGCTMTIPTGLTTGWQVLVYRVPTAGVITFTSSGTYEGISNTMNNAATAATIFHRGSNVHVAAGDLGVGGMNLGTATQVPFVNGTDDNFNYSSSFTWNSSTGLLTTTDLQLGESTIVGTSRSITAQGSATNIGLTLSPKGSGNVIIGTNATGVLLLGNGGVAGSRNIGINSSSSDVGLILETKGTGNFLITNTIGGTLFTFQNSGNVLLGGSTLSGTSRSLTCAGSATDIDLILGGKGTHFVNITGSLSLGATTTTGTARSISARGSGTDISINVIPKGNAGVGIGASVASTWLDVPASTTGRGSFRIREGVAPTSPNLGEFWTISDTIKYRTSSATKTIAFVEDISSGGIINTAANNEIPKSDGTDIGPSGVFSTTAGNIDMGGSSTTGTTRTLLSVGSETNIDLILQSKGSGSILRLSNDAIRLGRTTLGGNRNLWIDSSSTDSSLDIRPQGNGSVFIRNRIDPSNIYLDIQPFNSTGYVALFGAPSLHLLANTLKMIFDNANGKIKFENLPTSATDLSTGDLWSDSGVLTIVT